MGAGWSTSDISLEQVSGKVVLVTGANSGIGFYTALALGAAGAAEVILACRDRERGEEALAALRRKSASATCIFTLRLLDLSSLKDIRRFAEEFNAEGRAIDILINNAGVMMPPYALSADGFELQLATNHLGPFALVGLLMPSLRRCSERRTCDACKARAQTLESGGAYTSSNCTTRDTNGGACACGGTRKARVVAVSSMAAWRHLRQSNPIDFVKSAEGYDDFGVYGESKMANLLFTRELGRRYGSVITAVAAHPGASSTNLQRYRFSFAQPFCQSAADGALPIIRAASEAEAVVGAVSSGQCYFGPRGCGWAGCPSGAWMPPLARDEAYASAYWEASVKATGVEY